MKRNLLYLFLFVALLGLTAADKKVANDSDSAELVEKIERLTQRIEALEKQVSALEARFIEPVNVPGKGHSLEERVRILEEKTSLDVRLLKK